MISCLFFFNDTATTEIYTLSLHDALPICAHRQHGLPAARRQTAHQARRGGHFPLTHHRRDPSYSRVRSEEHTSELQSRQYLVCRLLLEKKKITSDLPKLSEKASQLAVIAQ